MNDLEEKNRWSGLKALRLGRYAHASALLARGGDQGSRWLAHWNRGKRIFQELRDTDTTVRLAAIGKWEQWQADHPGPRTWSEATAAVKSYSRALSVYSTTQDAQARYFQADPTSSGTVTIHGPVKLRIQVRPLHHRKHTQPISDWLQLSSSGVTRRVAISNNDASETLTIEGEQEYVPGALVTAEIDLPAGLNQFRINAARSPIAFRVLALRPEIASPVLPVVNETTLAMVISGEFGRTRRRCESKSCRGPADCVRLIDCDCACRSVPLSYLAIPCGCNQRRDAVFYFNQLKFGEGQPWQDRVIPFEQPLNVIGHDPIWVEAVEAAQMAEANEHFGPEFRLEGIVHIQQLINQHPDRTDLRRLLSRLTSGTSWESYRQFDSRAGIHSVPIDGWQPENPQLRIRKSLLTAEAPYVLTGSNQLSLAVDDPLGTKFQLTLRRPRLGFLPMGKTIAVLESKTQTRPVELDDVNELTVVHAQLEPGPDTIQVSHGNPLANHYIQVDVREVSADGSVLPIDRQQVRTDQEQRIYQVATEEEPLNFRVAAPALLRIDRYDDGVVTHDLVPVQQDRAFSLSPPPDRKMSMFRIFVMKFTEPTPTFRVQQFVPEPIAPAAGPIVQSVYQELEGGACTDLSLMSLLSPDVQPLPFVMRDDNDLGKQNGGTWEAQFGYRSRIAVDEFPRATAEDQFLEARLSRYLYDQWTDRYREHHLLVRPRFDSGLTLGMLHAGQQEVSFPNCDKAGCADRWGPLRIQWEGYYYQQLDAARSVDSVSSNPFSLGLSGRLSRQHQLTPYLRHRPSVTLFGRELSEDENGYPGGAADLDVFTNYKSDHRYGLRFADRLTYEPCLDQRWWIRTSLMSNQDQMIPDNLGVQFGTDQLLGPLQLNLAYRLTGYFADNDRRQSSLQNVVALDLLLGALAQPNTPLGTPLHDSQ